MDRKFLIVANLLFAGSLSVVAKSPAWEQCVKEVRGPLDKRSAYYGDVIDALEKLREEPMFATNAAARAFVDQQIVSMCFVPYHPYLKRWKPVLEERVPGAARRSVEDGAVPYERRADLAISLAKYYAGVENYVEAEKVLRGLPQPPKKTPSKVAVKVPLAIVRLMLWQDRFEDAWKEVEVASRVDALEAAKCASGIPKGDADGARVKSLWARVGNPLDLFDFYSEGSEKCPEYVKEAAFAFVTNASNRLDHRGLVVLQRYCGDDSPRSVAARKAIRGQDFSKSFFTWHVTKPVNAAYANENWALVEELFGIFGATKGLRSPDMQRVRFIALVRLGKVETAQELVAPDAPLHLKCLADMAKGKDPSAQIVGGELPRKDMLALLKALVSEALAMGRSEVAEKIAEAYAKCHVDYPVREQRVVFSREPVTSINDWRKLYQGLDRQFCDRPFGARLDILYTDVATGRKLVEKTDKDTVDVKMELSSVCDTAGLHLFLRVEDPNARTVEKGLAGGVGTEMYFAPGLYEPYICFGSDPRKGVESAFQTAYDSKAQTRIDVEGRQTRNDFRSEVQFTDTDYVLHLFFAWDPMAEKLPTKDTPWRFECIAFTPSGPFSWGGSEGVHNSSLWGNLVFDLKSEEIAAIRRAIIYRTVKTWRKPGLIEIFDGWADDAVGDPSFYAEVLKPLEKELKGYEKEVTADMDDATVNRIYAAAVPRWKNIKHEIDALRRDWLQAELTK